MDTLNNSQNFHHQFSAEAHNRAMDIIYGDNPTEAEIQSLIELAHVAHWHWLQRSDRQPQNLSVAQWLLSRAYAANGQAEQALRYAKASLATIENEQLLPSFYGYAHEAHARAYLLLGDGDRARASLVKAERYLERVPSPQAKAYLKQQVKQIVV